jgi:hypothetical protein
VRTEAALIPDWRDPEAYAALRTAERPLFAWEWLRRDPSYRSAAALAAEQPAARRAAPDPARFGLAAFEEPSRAAPDARPVWSAGVHPAVLSVRPGPGRGRSDLFDLSAFSRLARVVASDEADHLLLSDGLRSIRIDAPSGAFDAPVRLDYQLGGLASAHAPLLTLRRFLALARSGGFSASLHPREARAGRWILVLRAWDGLASGADQRRIAEVLLSRSAGQACWRGREPSLRSRAQRLVRSARAIAAGGYRSLLG